VVSRPVAVRINGTDEVIGEMVVQYGRRVSDTEATVARVELLLLLGVLAGSGLALLAGIAIARRAMSPIAELTSTAAEIARTRDPSRRVPEPEADDEVAELARTLQGMLREVEAARDALRRLTINLVENALRHTPPGTKISIWTASSNGQATLVVQDDGPGVPAELAPTLFERFVRGAGDRGGSFGLGLAIVKAVAE